MAVQPLVVAGIAAALLALSVGTDLAFARSLTVEVSTPEGWERATRVTLDSGGPPHGERQWSPTDAVDRNATVQVRLTLDNGYPWPAKETLSLQGEGCYQDAIVTLVLSAPASGTDVAEAGVRVQDLLQGAFGPYPVGAREDMVYTTLHVCDGDRYVAAVTIPIQGAAS